LLIRSSAQKSLALLQRSSSSFLDHGFVRDQAKCISCHQQTLPAVALALGRERGLEIDAAALGRQLVAQSRMLEPRVEAARQMDEPVPDPPVTLGHIADALAALNYPADETTTAMSHYLLGVQRAGGFWPTFDRRPPMEDGLIVGTAWAVRTIQLFPPRNRERDVRDALQRARSWLERQTPRTHNDRVFQLLGLVWSGQPRPALKPFIDAVLAGQGPDGGWSQLPTLPPDAWATGTALVALQKAAYGVWEEPYERGVNFLLRTQYDDGSWWVRSRSWPFQVHFDSQFPHGRDQWISAGATAWATSAILLSVPAERGLAPAGAKELMTRFEAASPGTERAAAMSVAMVPRGPGAIDFTRQIQPLFERSCVGCHGAEKPRGGFSLASLERMLRGGHSGEPAVVPGNSSASPLVRHIAGEIEELEMPPARRRDKFPALSADEIQLVRQWIDEGAVGK
jgi:mono/diheme cytochrome c family protein